MNFIGIDLEFFDALVTESRCADCRSFPGFLSDFYHILGKFVLYYPSGFEESIMLFKIIITKGEDVYYVANCPSLKSCWSQGSSKEEVLRNIREAIELYPEPASKPKFLTISYKCCEYRILGMQ